MDSIASPPTYSQAVKVIGGALSTIRNWNMRHRLHGDVGLLKRSYGGKIERDFIIDLDSTIHEAIKGTALTDWITDVSFVDQKDMGSALVCGSTAASEFRTPEEA